MSLISPTYRMLLRGIAFVYLLLFLTGLTCSGYFLKDVVALKPIPIIGLLKYLMLCVLFAILNVNALKAMTLAPSHINKFYRSTTNFKWLFLIALIIAVLAKLGMFNSASHQQTAVTNLHIMILLILGIFCFWTDAFLGKILQKPDSEQQAINDLQRLDHKDNQEAGE